MKQFFLFFAALAAGTAIAQPVISKVYGPGGTRQSEPQFMAMAPDSGFFMAGSLADPNIPGDALLIRINKNGDTLWTAGLSTSFTDGFGGVAALPDGGCAVIGTFNGPFIQQTTSKMVFARYNAAGTLLWAKSFSPSNYPSSGSSVIALPDNGFLLLGSVFLASQYSYDAFACRVDSSGTVTWSNVYRTSSSADEGFSRGRRCPDGSFLLTGTIAPPFLTTSMLLVKIDAGGNLIWSRKYNDANTSFNGVDLELKADGGCVVTGICAAGQSYEIYAVGYTASGDTTFSAHYGSPVNSEWGHSICASPGGFLLCGTTESFSGSPDAWLVSIDTAGQLRWSRSYGDGNWQEGWQAIPGPGNGYAVAAREQSSPGAYRFWFFRTDSAGNAGLCSESATNAVTGPQPSNALPAIINVVAAGQLATDNLTQWHSVPYFNSCIITGTEIPGGEEALLPFPVPAQNLLTIRSNALTAGTVVQVFDTQGKQVMEFISSGQTTQIDLGRLPDGIYFLQGINADGARSCGKFIVKR